MGSCIGCERATSGSLDWCQRCYKVHKDDILNKEEWVRSLKNASQRERRRREKEYADTSLDAIIDRRYERDY